MSHYTRLRTRLTRQDILVEALNSVGFAQVESHTEPQPLYGYLGDERSQKAEVIVRRKFVGEASNGLGFRRTKEGSFELVVSEFDARDGSFDARWLGGLQVAYARL